MHAIYTLTASDQKDLQVIDRGNRNPRLLLRWKVFSLK